MNKYEDVLNMLYEVLQPFAAGRVDSLSEDTQLVADLEIDSVKLLELLMEIEDHFDISIPMNVLPDVHTVKDMALTLYELGKQ